MMVTIGEQQTWNNIGSIARDLNRIANIMEGKEMRARQRLADLEPDSIGAAALWREEVSRGDTLLGFADWLAWHTADKEGKP
jgi:hypothetical protein